LFGLRDPAEAVGKTDFDFFSEEHARPAFEIEQNIIKTGQPVIDLEEKETWPDGRVNWVNTTKMPILDQAGNIIGTFGISSDITERKRSQACRKPRPSFPKRIVWMCSAVVQWNWAGNASILIACPSGLLQKIAPPYWVHMEWMQKAGLRMNVGTGIPSDPNPTSGQSFKTRFPCFA
jgi:PAS domain S-box-containing protein